MEVAQTDLRLLAALQRARLEGEWWGNDIYSVCLYRDTDSGWDHISYHRRDHKPIRDWRDGQRIKNEVCGPEREGIELYPAESRVVDSANEFHIWVAPEGIRLKVGWAERLVSDDAEGFPGAQQRPRS